MANTPTPHDYELIAHRDDVAIVRFTGELDGHAVIWGARIERLLDTEAAQFIDIRAPAVLADRQPCEIRIGLRVPRIDAATIAKTVIMVRQYKRLRRGRHEFNPG